jgi:hypothetical protein
MRIGRCGWLERDRVALGTSGLFTEVNEVVQRQRPGNLQQAFVHALLIVTVHPLTTGALGRFHEQAF